jgi:hypothetical protein
MMDDKHDLGKDGGVQVVHESHYDGDGYDLDKRELDATGHEVVHLKRRFSMFACLGIAFAILNSWTAMASSLQIVLPSGGSITMVWGLVVSSLGAFVMVLSLAEICQTYPLTGGQYDWACKSKASHEEDGEVTDKHQTSLLPRAFAGRSRSSRDG